MKNESPVGEMLQAFSHQRARLVELLLEQKARDTQRIKPYPRLCQHGLMRAPISAAQQRLWLISQLEGGTAAYHIAFAFRLTGALDDRVLRLALDAIVRRHEILRTVIVEEEGVPSQIISPPGAFDLTNVDLSDHPPAAREALLRRYQQEEAQQPFELSKGPLARGRLLRLESQHHVLLLTMHHVIFDGWSVSILLSELGALYEAFINGRENPLQPLPIQYADYTQWQRQWLDGPILQRQLDYWDHHLRDAQPQLELPLDRARPLVQSFHGETFDLVFDSELSARLKAFAQQHDLTLFMLLYAGFALLLSRLSGQDDIVIGTPIANRQLPELEGLIGFFVNTLALRIEVNGELPLQQFLEQVRGVIIDAYDHQDVPFEKVVERLQPDRTLNSNPLFQVMLVVLNTPSSAMSLSGLTVTKEAEPSGPAKFDLLLSLEESGKQIAGTVNFATDLFERATIERWMDCFLELLSQMVESSPAAAVGDLSILSEREVRTIALFNDTAVERAPGTLIHELFEAQACATPDAVAVEHDDLSMTYAELNAAANRLAGILMRRDVGPDQLVGICVERGPQMVVGLLGTLKAGGAYLPLDPEYPQDRLQYMLTDAKPSVVLTQKRLLHRLADASVALLVLDEIEPALEDDTGTNPLPSAIGLTDRNLLYVIYTSGSTGRPKGIAMSHGAMVNLIEWHRRTLSAAGQRVLQFAALSFDVAFQETFSTLCTGGTLVLLHEWIRKDATALLELLEVRGVQRLFVPPMMLQSLAEAAAIQRVNLKLRDVITAGEQLRIGAEVIRFFQERPTCRLHNHYGPTETHVVTALTLSGSADRWPPLPTIGKPIANTRIHVLDARRKPVPVGVAGEIYVAGANLARGYIDRQALTQERFGAEPFSVHPDARMYKTGDLGRWLADGTVEYFGRNDDQVKLRGFRIELGEIEAQLERHIDVLDAAVIVREDVPGDKRLVAYVVGRDGRHPQAGLLREHLKQTLPGYMLPAAFVMLERLPVTSNGKLNRRALPAPDPHVHANSRYEVPQGPIEEMLVAIWQEVLLTRQIGRHDNFFELGGHSLLAVRMLYKVNRAFDCAMRVTEVYRAPTISELAQRIAGQKAEEEFVDLAREAVLEDDIRVDSSLKRSVGAVFLTGATGFVGRFLLAQLLQDTSARIYCLVRATSSEDAEARLRTTMLKWDLWREDYRPRITAVPGDLRLPRLGIQKHDYDTLCREVDCIYHCATSMNHLETYATAKPANVGAAKELLRMASRERLKLINNISTLGVFARSANDGPRTVDEHSSIDQERHASTSGYIASKWVAEKIFEIGGERGIPCNQFRLGLIWPDSRRGRYDELQHDYRLFKSCLLSGYAIEGHQHPSAPLPVDYVARAVVFLAQKYDAGSGRFHISSSRPSTRGIFERCNEVAGVSLQLLTHYDWIRRMKQLHEAGISLPIVPLVAFAFSMDEVAFERYQQQVEASTVTAQCAFTDRELASDGIVAPVFGDYLIKAFIDDMLSRDEDVSGHEAMPASL